MVVGCDIIQQLTYLKFDVESPNMNPHSDIPFALQERWGEYHLTRNFKGALIVYPLYNSFMLRCEYLFWLIRR